MATRDEAWQIAGSRAFTIFVYNKPRLGLSSGQQDLLQQALAGESDELAAQRLFVGISAVEKRWLSIYDSVREIDPGVLGEAASSMATSSNSRRIEKRRHLLR